MDWVELAVEIVTVFVVVSPAATLVTEINDTEFPPLPTVVGKVIAIDVLETDVST